jgi:ABC-type dipeptide/oligopeptide/nickel transport system permease subunit
VRGIVGNALMRFTDLMMAFPALLLAIVLAALLRPSLWIVAMVIALVNWVQVARIVYTETRGLWSAISSWPNGRWVPAISASCSCTSCRI